MNYLLFGSILLNVLLAIMVLQKDKTTKLDPLTKLFNMRAFERHFYKMKSKHKEQGHLSIAFIDIDFFKQVNDSHGHAVGDTILVHLAQRIKNELRKCDFVARYGGEEYIVALSNCEKMKALQIMERIRRSIDDHPFHLHHAQVNVTVSIGVSTYPPTPFDFLIKYADEALYQAKRDGRNLVSHNENRTNTYQ